jgi:hypothetical protein
VEAQGWILSGDGREEDAEEQFERALHICASNQFGEDHPVFRRVQVQPHKSRFALSGLGSLQCVSLSHTPCR